MERALRGRVAWLSGLRRADSPTRTQVPVIQRDRRGLVKVNPLVDWSDDDVARYIAEHDVPVNPLLEQGFTVDRLLAVHPRPSPMARTGGPAAGTARARPSAGSTCDGSSRRGLRAKAGHRVPGRRGTRRSGPPHREGRAPHRPSRGRGPRRPGRRRRARPRPAAGGADRRRQAARPAGAAGADHHAAGRARTPPRLRRASEGRRSLRVRARRRGGARPPSGRRRLRGRARHHLRGRRAGAGGHPRHPPWPGRGRHGRHRAPSPRRRGGHGLGGAGPSGRHHRRADGCGRAGAHRGPTHGRRPAGRHAGRRGGARRHLGAAGGARPARRARATCP